MNPDILFNILLHCDIDTIQSFSCVKKTFLLGRYSPKQRFYFWRTKFEKDHLRLIIKKGKTIEWINEYKKVLILHPIINDMVAQLLSLNTKPYSGIYMYIQYPVNLLKILPKVVHHKNKYLFTPKICFTRQNNIITLYNDRITRHGTKEKSLVVTIDEMESILWHFYYYNDTIDCHIK